MPILDKTKIISRISCLKLSAVKHPMRASTGLSTNLVNQKVFNPVSDALFNKVRVYCFIMSTKDEKEGVSRHVHATWAKRCNKHVFVTANEASGLPSLDFGLNQTRDNLYLMIENTLKHIYDNELENYDFFLKADYDAYVVMENLRFMLLPYDPDNAYHFGCRFKHKGKLYMSGGAGYVFSREAIRRMAEHGFSKRPECNKSDRPGEDVEIAQCAAAVNVTAVDIRDRLGRHKMLPDKPTAHLTPQPLYWGFNISFVHKYSHGEQALNEYMISFHHVDTNMMYVLDSMFYKFRRVSLMDITQVDQFDNEDDLIDSLKALSIENLIAYPKY
uniref:N-acetylgalactosaminide beta-1,3-galactosyltransferase n=1 Tax=Panagrellus redivivus TaxID=6233 RepID=A0A7E4VIR6_PANRE